jgi:hypothetical protein
MAMATSPLRPSHARRGESLGRTWLQPSTWLRMSGFGLHSDVDFFLEATTARIAREEMTGEKQPNQNNYLNYSIIFSNFL